MIVLYIPILGIIMSFVWGLKPIPTNRRSLARAMIVLNVIGLIIFIAGAVSAYSVWKQLSDLVDFSFDLFGRSIKM